MDSQSFRIYGVRDVAHLRALAIDTAREFAYGANPDTLAKMLLETAIVETDGAQAYMDTARKYGRSVMQIDEIGYKEALRVRALRNCPAFETEIQKGYLSEELQRNPRFAMFLARMIYLGKSTPIPATLGERAAYWKRFYNTIYGAGSAEHYLRLVKKHLGADYE